MHDHITARLHFLSSSPLRFWKKKKHIQESTEHNDIIVCTETPLKSLFQFSVFCYLITSRLQKAVVKTISIVIMQTSSLYNDWHILLFAPLHSSPTFIFGKEFPKRLRGRPQAPLFHRRKSHFQRLFLGIRSHRSETLGDIASSRLTRLAQLATVLILLIRTLNPCLWSSCTTSGLTYHHNDVVFGALTTNNVLERQRCWKRFLRNLVS